MSFGHEFPKQIVSDTGPLISLEKLTNGFGFIRVLYEKVIVPLIVLEEVSRSQFRNPNDYLNYYNIANLIETRSVSSDNKFWKSKRLHEGESQAIQLALDLGLPLLIEETLGRNIALESGIHISGIAGQIVKALRLKHISLSEALNKLGELYHAGRINRKIFQTLITEISNTEFRFASDSAYNG